MITWLNVSYIYLMYFTSIWGKDNSKCLKRGRPIKKTGTWLDKPSVCPILHNPARLFHHKESQFVTTRCFLLVRWTALDWSCHCHSVQLNQRRVFTAVLCTSSNQEILSIFFKNKTKPVSTAASTLGQPFFTSLVSSLQILKAHRVRFSSI